MTTWNSHWVPTPCQAPKERDPGDHQPCGADFLEPAVSWGKSRCNYTLPDGHLVRDRGLSVCTHLKCHFSQGSGSPPRACHLSCKRSLPWCEVEAVWQARGLPGGKGWCVWGTECRPGWPELLGREKERQREQTQQQPGADYPPFSLPFLLLLFVLLEFIRPKLKGPKGIHA